MFKFFKKNKVVEQPKEFVDYELVRLQLVDERNLTELRTGIISEDAFVKNKKEIERMAERIAERRVSELEKRVFAETDTVS